MMAPRLRKQLAALREGHFEHGTRARYALGCRCADCRRSAVEYESERTAKKRALAVELFGPRTQTHCIGVNGQPCPASRKLRADSTSNFCNRCVVKIGYNGPVDAAEVRTHLAALSDAGVGYKSVASACDVAASTIGDIIRGTKRTVRAETARRILAVDAGAAADHATIVAAETWRLLGELLELGYTRGELAKQLGAAYPALQLRKERVLAKTAARVKKLHARIVDDMRQRLELRDAIAEAGGKGSEYFAGDSYSFFRHAGGTKRAEAVCGTNTRYIGGCRCEPCRAAHNVYNRERYAKKKRARLELQAQPAGAA